MQQNGDGSDDADTISGQVGSTDGQSIGEVVGEIRCQIQVAGDFDLVLLVFLFDGFALGFGSIGFSLLLVVLFGDFVVFFLVFLGRRSWWR